MTDATPAASPSSTGPTVLLVHGAFADSSGWTGVIERLQAAGVQVQAIPNPLRGVTADSAYVASAIAQTPGPVLAVAHSYGGVAITNAATNNANVVGLVYVAGFAPDEGEILGEVATTSKDSVLNSALVPLNYPTGQGEETAQEFVINQALFQEAFAADVPDDVAAVMWATQRPISAFAFSEPNGPPAWKSLPSWAVVATGDKTIGTDLVRSMAERRGHDHGGRGLARDHGFPAPSRHRRDPDRRKCGFMTSTAWTVCAEALPSKPWFHLDCLFSASDGRLSIG